MCSIAGIYRMSGTLCGDDMALLASMSSSMRNRGPDADGVYPNTFCAENMRTCCALAHNRLAVVDLEGGKR